MNLELLNDPNQSQSAAQCWKNARRNKRTLKEPPAFSKAGPESEVLTSTERSKSTIKAAQSLIMPLSLLLVVLRNAYIHSVI